MGDLKEQIDVLRQMEKARDAIKRKYNSFKTSKLNNEKLMSETFKPIVEPLEKLVDVTEIHDTKRRKKIKLKREKNDKVKEEDEVKPEEVIEEQNDGDVSKTEFNEDEEETYVDAINETELVADNTKNNSIDDKKHDLANKYLNMLRIGDVRLLDVVYGVRKLSSSLMIGDSRVDFDKEFILLNDKKYMKNPGLIELIFKKVPDSSLITKDDLSKYGQILKETNAYKKYYKEDEDIREQNSKKFNDYISKAIVPSKRRSGTGLLPSFKIAQRQALTDYIYWDDPNELVDRLRLLIAETTAGNQNHVNEIQSIIEELHEAKIIH